METKQDVIKLVEDDIATIKRQMDALSRALVGHNTVIALSEGMYLRNDGGVTSVTGITRCSRWYPEDAARHCANDNIKDGAGNVGRPVKLHDALATELVRSQKLLAVLEK